MVLIGCNFEYREKPNFMKKHKISRRKFIGTASAAAVGSATFGLNLVYGISKPEDQKDIVSIVRIRDGNIARAVEEAIDLLGGIKAVTSGKTE